MLAFLAGVVILVGAGPASAVSEESSATPLVGSGVIATCPTGSGGDVAGGSPTIGIVTVGDPAGGRCAPHAAAADGTYEVGAIGEDEGLRFSPTTRAAASPSARSTCPPDRSSTGSS